MGKRIFGFSVENSLDYIEATCIIERKSTVVDEFEIPYKGFEVLIDVDEETEENIYGVAVNGAENLLKVIDNKDCLPDIGLLDYENIELGLNLKNISLRELYKQILIMVLVNN